VSKLTHQPALDTWDIFYYLCTAWNLGIGYQLGNIKQIWQYFLVLALGSFLGI
jgi:hypothetical protein